ncbi:TPA: hypothetical protein ACN33X_001566 [Vibrio parahaemolyticus]
MKIKVLARGYNSPDFMKPLKNDNSLDSLIDRVEKIVKSDMQQTQDTAKEEISAAQSYRDENDSSNGFKM